MASAPGLGLAVALSVVAALGLGMSAGGQEPGQAAGAQQSGSATSSQASDQKLPQFGGAYSGLGARRQKLVDNLVDRFNKVSGQKLEAGAFYDNVIKFSSKTTFDAVTHALMMIPLTDASGAPLGDALDLVERVDAVRGEVPGTSGDRQFRMYSVLTPGARDVLDRSRQFKRGRDNTIYHKGYPISYREQGGAPSVQISMATDGRRADIDVDYRSSSFPAAVFNGHLTAANSDVRAGNNYDRHTSRWTGFQNWWRSFFGVRLERDPADVAKAETQGIPSRPRAGARPIDLMVGDFMGAWLLEGDIVAAMGYVSERAWACLAEDSDDPLAFDRGMAPVQIMMRLKAAHDALGKHDSLDGLSFGVRLGIPALRLVTQPHHAQYVVYAVPDDVAARFDCELRLSPGSAAKVSRVYGNFYASVFRVGGAAGTTVALLWAKEKDYWRIVSWKTDADEEDDKTPPPDAAPDVTIVKVKADATLVQAAKGFLDSWLVRKDYDAAFRYLSAESYGCYNESRSPGAPAANSPADAGRLIRAGLERVGNTAGKASLASLVTAAEPVHPAVRVMEHSASHTFTLVSYPDGLGELAGCATAVSSVVKSDLPPEYGKVFGMNIRFITAAGEAPVMRTLWMKDASTWRIAAYYIEYP